MYIGHAFDRQLLKSKGPGIIPGPFENFTRILSGHKQTILYFSFTLSAGAVTAVPEAGFTRALFNLERFI